MGGGKIHFKFQMKVLCPTKFTNHIMSMTQLVVESNKSKSHSEYLKLPERLNNAGRIVRNIRRDIANYSALLFQLSTTLYPLTAFRSCLISVLVRTALVGTFCTSTSSLTRRILPAASGLCNWKTVAPRLWIPSASRVRLDDWGRPMAERRRVMRKWVLGGEDEEAGAAVAIPRAKTREKDMKSVRD
jgi:hypothetical protein